MSKWAAILVLAFLLTGCSDRHEIEEDAFVIAIGLDDSPVKGAITVTFQIANPQAGIPNTGGEKEPSSEIITFTAPDFLTARDLANSTVTRRLSFSHTKVLIIGEAFAKKDKGKKHLLSGIRDREMRRELNLIVSKEKASTFIRNNIAKLETRAHKYYDLMTTRWKETGLVPVSTLQRFLQRYESGNDAFLAIYASTEKKNIKKTGNEDDYMAGQIDQKGGNITQVIGSAVFHDGIMVGELTGEETRLALNLRPHSTAEYMKETYQDPINPDYRVAAQLRKLSKTKINVLTNKKPAVIDVSVPIYLEIIAIPSEVNYVTDRKKQELLRQSIEKEFTEKYNALVKKSQDTFKNNPFNWSNLARRNFLTTQAYENYDWEKHYPTAKVHVKVKVHFTGFGKQLVPPKYEGMEQRKK